ncbi:type I restriction modification DNA specificity domain protein [Desulfosporosinus acididurans]|uniref:Type I restriction modification DNA specificity domain protein n=1 Tax=Desulfosporosinus acididurans TaxID=476652 RepID=A0A0J1FKD5_9FIRM|nr:restriction endonuclease subunit S [Desulfosporosinus acididurans]KLU63882.1 type I restriction modification DNA specificity domain protein [Desulfosporosinus acididurans]
MGEWKCVQLGNYLVEHTEKTTQNNQYPVLTSSREGIFLQTDYYNRVVASKDNTGYNVVPYGYFTYRHMSDDVVFRFNINNIVEKGIVSTLYPVFTTRNIDDYFLRTILNYGSEFKKFAFFNQQGLSRTYVYFSMLKKLYVTIPDLDEQRRIAAVLAAADEAIVASRALVEKYAAVKQGLMQDLLGKGELTLFADLADSITRKERATAESVCLNMDCIESGSGKVISRSFDSMSSDKIVFKAGDLLFAKLRPYLRKYWLADMDGLCSSEFLVFKIKPKVRSKYLYYIVSSNEFVEYNNSQTFGTKMPRTSWSIAKKYQVRVPSLDEQDRIIEILTAADERLTAEWERLRKLEDIKRGLMDDLLTNRVSTDKLQGGV